MSKFLASTAVFLTLFTLMAVSAQAGSRDAGEVAGLIEGLRSADPSVRSQAEYALVKIGKDAVPALIEELEKGGDIIEVVYVFNSIKDERVAEPLSRLLSLEEGEALDRVSSALYSLGPASVPCLFDAIKDPARAAHAASVLASLREPKYFTRLRESLKDKDPLVRACMAKVERSWLDPDAAGAMAALLEDHEATVRLEASGYFLGQSPNMETPGLDVILADSDEGVRTNALRIAVKDRKADYCNFYKSILGNDPSAEARRLSAEALFRCCGEQAAPALISGLRDGDDAVAAACAAYLGELKATAAAPALTALLVSKGKPSDAIVDSVAGALADIGDGFDPDIFLPYINWDNLYVVRSVLRAWEAGARPGDTGIEQALKDYLDMRVDNRYKERVGKLIERLRQPADPARP